MKKTLTTLTLSFGIAFLGSCQNYGTAAQNDAATGALIGGAAGALIGKDSGNAGTGAAIGAALGGATGYVVGDQKDQRRYRSY